MATAAPNADAVRQVEALQRDGLLLIAYLAERSDRPLVQNGPDHGEPVELGVLTVGAGEVAGDADRFAALLKTIDRLGRLAAPATTATIRVSADYLLGTPDLTALPARGRLKAPTRSLSFILGLLLLATSMSVYFLWQVDDGRRTMGQLATVTTALTKTFDDMGRLNPEKDWILPPDAGAVAPRVAALGPVALPDPKSATYAVFCEADPPSLDDTAAPGDPPVIRKPATPQAQGLCSQLNQLRLREAIVYASLTAWNCGMAKLHPVYWLPSPAQWLASLRDVLGPATTSGAATAGVAPARSDTKAKAMTEGEETCPGPPYPVAKPANESHWQRTEVRTSANIAMLTGYILPVLLGCIGGCVYVLRRCDDKINSWTLAARDGRAGLVRVVLAGTLGGLLGVVFGTGEAPVQVGGFSLSLAAWAFFLGYALETVLRLLDTIVRSVVEKLQVPESSKPVTVTAKTGP